MTRLVTNGHRNACSFLYAAAARVSREMGFERIQTFILDEETGNSLKAAGWSFDGISDGGSWNNRGGRRDDPHIPRQRWIKTLNAGPRFIDLFGNPIY